MFRTKLRICLWTMASSCALACAGDVPEELLNEDGALWEEDDAEVLDAGSVLDPISEEVELPQPVSPRRTTSPHDARPAPASVPLALLAPRPEDRRQTYQAQLASRTKVGQAGKLAVVSGRVVGATVSQRPLPRHPMFDPGDQITTAAEFEVERWLCGEPEGKSVLVSYLGGAWEGIEERNSAMPRDLSEDTELVLVLENIEGEWFLAAGLYDVLTPSSGGELAFRDGSTTTSDELSEVCR